MHSHFQLWHFNLKRELTEFYLSITIRTMALGLIGIFIPLYLYNELGFTLQQVMHFYLVFFISFILFTPLAAKSIYKIGYKHTILISIPLLIIYFLLLFSLEYVSFSYLWIAFIGGLSDALFWLSFHLDFVKCSDHNHRGEEVGLWFALSLIVNVLAPFLGGLILTYFFGFKTLFIIVAFLLFVSIIPLFMSGDGGMKDDFSFMSLIKSFSLRNFLAFFAYGTRHSCAMILWPLFVFVILKNYLNLGSLASIIFLLSAFSVLLAGRLTKGYGDKIIRYSSVIMGVSWFFRYFVKSIMQVFWITAAGDVSFALMDVPFCAKGYNRVKNIEYLIWREWGISAGRLVVFSLVLLTSDFLASFVVNGLSSIFFLFF